MVRAWYMDDEVAFPRKEHHRIPPQFVTLEELYKISGVEYFQVTPESYETDNTFKQLVEDRGNNVQQLIDNPNEDELKQHFAEHFHTDDEFRLVLEGCGYFDIRDKFDDWIRVEVLPGDLLVIPGGCYHRFIVDHKNVYKGLRILKEEVYQAHNRPADDLQCRKEYIRKLYNGAYDEPKEEINLV